MSVFYGRPDLMLLFLAQVLLILLQIVILQRFSGRPVPAERPMGMAAVHKSKKRR